MLAVASLFSCIIVFLGVATLYPPWMKAKREKMRAKDLPLTIQNAQPIITAINQYHHDQGKPPSTLNELIPRYIAKLPDTGPIAEDGWQYRIETGKSAGGWTLYIGVRDEYSPNIFFGFGDYFVYHPSDKYPQTGYGGALEPFGKWGYYIE